MRPGGATVRSRVRGTAGSDCFEGRGHLDHSNIVVCTVSKRAEYLSRRPPPIARYPLPVSGGIATPGHHPSSHGFDATPGVCHSVVVFVTNHVLAGALIGRRFARRPLSAFFVGFGSHLLMDAVPHWGCDLREPGGPDRFLRAARRDGLLGLAVLAGCVWTADRKQVPAAVAAIAGAVFLDVDKPSEYFFDRNPIPDWLQRIHGRIQRESDQLMIVEVATGLALAVVELAGSRPWSHRGTAAHHHALCSSGH